MWKNIKSYFKDLGKPWLVFVKILSYPPVLITLLITLIATYLSTLFNWDVKFAVSLSIIASLSSGILGGVIFDKYQEYSGNKVLVKKGKSAVRNLSLIADQLHRLRIRLSEFNAKKIRISIDEIDHHLVTTEKSVISGIEDWVDMVPELTTLTKLFETVVERGNKMLGLINEKKELEKELQKQDKAQKEKVTSLESRINQKNKEISNLSFEISKLRRQQISIGGPTISSGLNIGSLSAGAFGNINGNIVNVSNLRNCQKCGNEYNVSSFMVDLGLCSNCSLFGY